MANVPQTFGAQQGAKRNVPISIKFDSNFVGVSAGGAAVSLAFTADPARGNVIKQINYSYSSAPTGGRLSISDGTNTLLDLDISGAGPGVWEAPFPMVSAANTTLTVTLAGGGGAIVGKLNVYGWIEL